jgi:WD40 repeat protein
LLKRLLRFTALTVIFSISLTIYAQSTDQLTNWSVIRDCFPVPEPRPDDYTFNGFIASYVSDDGIRALRSETFTTYYLAFAGSNFIEMAAFSPDGRWLTVPYGFIETAAAFDIRYRVGELRVMTTGTFPQISARLPWQASFQQGNFTRIRWLDGEAFLYPQGSFLDGQSMQQVQPFTGAVSSADGRQYQDLSPDETRGFQPITGRLALFDIQRPSEDALAYFPVQQANLSSIVWSPDSSQFAALEADTDAARWLTLYSRDGTSIARVFDLTTEHLLANLRWLPDSTKLAFTAYDPYDNENTLYLADITNQTVRDTCILLNTRYTQPPTEALAWSPDSASLALALPDGFYIFDSVENGLYRIGNDIGGLMAWMLGE